MDNFGIFSNQWVTLSSAVRHKVTTADIEMDASNTATLTASSCTMVGGLLLSHAAVAYRCLVLLLLCVLSQLSQYQASPLEFLAS